MEGLFTRNRVLRLIALLLILAAGLGIRLLDLTEPPLDIHPTRQLHSALMARGLYYQHVTDAPEWQIKMAIAQGKREAVIEPPVMETLTAWLYRAAGGEYVWIARILSALFWVLAGIAIYLLATALTNADGGITALLFYLFQTYAVVASRTFQPDPLMVSLICWAWWAFYNWHGKRSWKWTILAGLLSGAAVFVKNVSVFFLAFPFIVLLWKKDIRPVLKDGRVWVVAMLALLPAVVYTLYGTYVAGFLGQQFSFRIFPELWVNPSNYSRWLKTISDTAGIPALILALAGMALHKLPSARKYLAGMWAGYLVYGMTFAYHIGTHDYYQLPLLPLLALCIAPLGSLVAKEAITIRSSRYTRPALVGLVVLITGLLFWQDRSILAAGDYRAEVTLWQQLGEKLRGQPVAGLTEDYGYRPSFYGWFNVENWPGSGDLAVRELAGREGQSFEKRIDRYLDGKNYFLVTWFDDYARQPDLQAYLEDNFPVERGDGYLLFDLANPLVK